MSQPPIGLPFSSSVSVRSCLTVSTVVTACFWAWWLLECLTVFRLGSRILPIYRDPLSIWVPVTGMVASYLAALICWRRQVAMERNRVILDASIEDVGQVLNGLVDVTLNYEYRGHRVSRKVSMDVHKLNAFDRRKPLPIVADQRKLTRILVP